MLGALWALLFVVDTAQEKVAAAAEPGSMTLDCLSLDFYLPTAERTGHKAEEQQVIPKQG